MYKVFLKIGLIAVSLITLSCGSGSTTINLSHPALLNSGSAELVPVYFMRPQHGFGGALNPPINISLNGIPLIKLAKGTYTLVFLPLGDYKMTLTYPNDPWLADENYPFELKNQDPLYLSFTFNAAKTFKEGFIEGLNEKLTGVDPRPLGFVVKSEAPALAFSIASILLPIGLAVDHPITQNAK